MFDILTLTQLALKQSDKNIPFSIVNLMSISRHEYKIEYH